MDDETSKISTLQKLLIYENHVHLTNQKPTRDHRIRCTYGIMVNIVMVNIVTLSTGPRYVTIKLRTLQPFMGTLKPHERRTVIQQYVEWNTGR